VRWTLEIGTSDYDGKGVGEILRTRLPEEMDKLKSSNGERLKSSRVRRFQICALAIASHIERNQLLGLEVCPDHLNLAGGVKQIPAMDTTARVDTFSAFNRQECEKYVNKMQRQIHKAVEAGKWRKVRYLAYLLTRRSRAIKILATYRITTGNGGKHTAGVDNVRIPRGISFQ
jgi:hypothetical protein